MSIPYMLAALASFKQEDDGSSREKDLPSWSLHVIARIEETPSDLDFSSDYSTLPADEWEYVESLNSKKFDKNTGALLNFAKVELSRLSKRLG